MGECQKIKCEKRAQVNFNHQSKEAESEVEP